MSSAEVSSLASQFYGSYSGNCVYAGQPSDTYVSSKTCQWKNTAGQDIYGICQYTECTAKDGKICIFPFR